MAARAAPLVQMLQAYLDEMGRDGKLRGTPEADAARAHALRSFGTDREEKSEEVVRERSNRVAREARLAAEEARKARVAELRASAPDPRRAKPPPTDGSMPTQ